MNIPNAQGYVLIESIASFVDESGNIFPIMSNKEGPGGLSPDLDANSINMSESGLSCEVFLTLNDLDKEMLSFFVSKDKLEAMQLNAIRQIH